MALAKLGANEVTNINVVSQSSCIASPNPITGGDDAVRVWPTSFGAWSRDATVFPLLLAALMRPV